MATIRETKLQKRWKKLVNQVSSAGILEPGENETTQLARIARARTDYNYFVTYYFPHLAKCPCAKFHIDTANQILKDKDFHGILEWGRGLAKSTHADIFLPLWLKIQEPRQIDTMMLIGKNNKVATRLLQDVQAELAVNPRYIHDFGQQVKEGSWEQGEFVCLDGFAAVAYGMGEPPRGTRFGANRPNYIVADDLDDDKLKKNPKRVREAVDWLYRAVLPTKDVRSGRFVFVNNRICKNGILATLASERPHWKQIKVNALDARGKPAWPEKDTAADYARLRKNIGPKAFQTEYLNDPVEDGGVFLEEWINWKMPLLNWLDYDGIVCYADFSYSTSVYSDYTAIKCWARKGLEKICLKAYVRQNESPAKAISWMYDFYLSLPEPVRKKIRWYAEANFTQKIILKPIFEDIAERRKVPLFVRLDMEKKGDKEDRIGSMSVEYENGHVFYNILEKDSPDMQTGIGQLTSWAEGAVHDDSPDADQSAWQKLQANKVSGRKMRTGTYTRSNSRSYS